MKIEREKKSYKKDCWSIVRAQLKEKEKKHVHSEESNKSEVEWTHWLMCGGWNKMHGCFSKDIEWIKHDPLELKR